MKKLNMFPSIRIASKKFNFLFAASVLGCLIWLPATAQTVPPVPVQQTPATPPLNLDADEVVKEINKDPRPVEPKAGAISTTHDVFAQSILDSENRKKVSGFVEGGAAVGSFQPPHGQKSENFTCENTAAGVNDQISQNTQVSVYAQVDSCRPR